jgi:hypothetical protein
VSRSDDRKRGHACCCNNCGSRHNLSHSHSHFLLLLQISRKDGLKVKCNCGNHVTAARSKVVEFFGAMNGWSKFRRSVLRQNKFKHF